MITRSQLEYYRQYSNVPLVISVRGNQIPVPDDAEVLIKSCDGFCYSVPITEITRIGLQSFDYRQYINSDYWVQRKALYFKTHPKVCTVCGATDKIHLHHINYDSVGYEGDCDLEPLCENCHRVLHSIKDQQPETKEELYDMVSRFFPLCIPVHKPHIASVIHYTVFHGKLHGSGYLVKALRGIPKK